MPKLFRSFYSKLALSVLASFLLIAILQLFLVQHTSSQHQQEIEQKLHLQLAEHLVHDNQLFTEGELNKAAIKHAFHAMMILGPSFEFYILDPKGKVLTYSAEKSKIKREQLNLTPIQQFLTGNVQLPLVGDDPRSVNRQKIFSVAEIKEADDLRGYLYIIIGGEIYDDLASQLRHSHISAIGAWGTLLTLGFSLLLILTISALLTRPIKRLAKDMSQLKQEGFAQGTRSISSWHCNSHDEIQKLGCAFNEMAASLNQQYQRVQNMDQLRRELISYVSHDLRTPLASLQGYLETWQLKKSSLSEQESQKLIEIALDNARKTSNLVEQLFELAHLDSENYVLNTEPVSLAELVHDVMQKLQLTAEQKGVRLSVVPEDPALIAKADIQRIERVFTNLIDNAIRHCHQGDQVTVFIDKDENNNLLVVRVTDTGIGIDADELPYIFEPHYKASNSARGNRNHSGLGLAITRRILQLHQSQIEVISKPSQGTEFQFQLSMA